MAISNFRDKALEKFLNQRDDRRRNPFFAGRNKLLAEINTSRKNFGKDYANGDKLAAWGKATLILGPPGVGKTSVLETLQQECIREIREGREGPRTIPVILPDPAYLSREYLANHMSSAIKELLKELTKIPEKGTLGNLMDSLTSVTIRGFTFDATQWQNEDPLLPENYTILLMMDEIQNIPAGRETEESKVIRMLQGGSQGYPILPIFAGMPNSVDILAQAGLYRFRTEGATNLYPLEPEEVNESFRMFLDYFNIGGDEETRQQWAEWVIAWSDCWPKHLQNCMLALGSELLRVKGDINLVDDHQVKLRAMQHRIGYYEESYQTFRGTDKYNIVGEIMAELGEGKNISRIGDIIKAKRDAYGLDHYDQEQSQEGYNFNTLLRKGFVYPDQEGGRKNYSCTIPSLQSYAVAHTGNDVHMDAYEGRSWVIAKHRGRGLDLNSQDAWGRTPLHIASENNWDKVVDLLLRHGADPNIVNKSGQLPVDNAREDSATALILTKISTPRLEPGDDSPPPTAPRPKI